MTSSVNVTALRVCSDAISTPETAASPAPSAHAIIAVRPGRPPLSRSRSRSSTIARIATPSRVRRSTSRRPIATAIAMAMVMIREYGTATPAMSTVLPAKKGGTGRATSGGQMTFAMPSRATMRLTVTTIFTTSEAPSMPRMIPRSTAAPNSGPITNTTRMTDGTTGTPHPWLTCQ